jgi:ATP-dependent Lon protease
VRSRAVAFGIRPPLFGQRDIHVHVPEGATPKDGPSAGVAMVTVIVSVMTGVPVRRDLAMTGEITLRGRVWPIAGLKEKLLAALLGGIKTVLIPEENAKGSRRNRGQHQEWARDRSGRAPRPCVTRKLEPIEWDETTTTAAAGPEEAPVEEEVSTLTSHLTDRDTGAEAAVTSQNFIHSSRLGDSSRSLGGNHHGSCGG